MAEDTRKEQPQEPMKKDYEEPSLVDLEDLEKVSGGALPGGDCNTGGSVVNDTEQDS
jgi:hypothetical protein